MRSTLSFVMTKSRPRSPFSSEEPEARSPRSPSSIRAGNLVRGARSFIVPLILLVARGASGDVAVPQRVLNPVSAAEAWNVIRLAAGNVDRLLNEQRPLEIAEQISLCSPALRVLARHLVKPGSPSGADDVTTRAYRAVNLMARESMADNLVGAQNVFVEFKKCLNEMERDFDPSVVKSEIYSCPDHPDTLSTEAGTKCDRCGRTLQVRRIPYSFIYVKPDKPSLKLSAHLDAPLQAGREARGRIRLKTVEGRPVAVSDLLVTHSLPIHLLIIGPDERDFHHRAPVATATDGEFEFSFTPALPGPYRVWAGVVPAATGLQEYPFADLPTGREAPPGRDENEVFAGIAGGLRFQLSIVAGQGFGARAGRIQMIRIDIADADGRLVQRLEPLMNAFAHLTGFYADGEAVIQIHPTGGDILREDLRGGPTLAFKFFAPRSGLLKLYCQVRVDGREIVVPFAINVRD